MKVHTTKDEIKELLERHKDFLDQKSSEPVDFLKYDLSGYDLREADLREADLSCSNLCKAYLFKADLREADLSWANLRGADLREADLSDADLSGAALSMANLSDIVGKEIFTFQFGKHFGYYVDAHIKIGCEYLSVDEWVKKYKKIGKDNQYSERQIQVYGAIINFIKEHIQ